MEVPRLLAIDHVRLLASPETVESLDLFYVEQIGFERLRSPEPELIIYRGYPRSGPRLQIRLVDDPGQERGRRQAVIQVASLAGLIELLDEERRNYSLVQGFSYYERRLLLEDPAGNRVELVESHAF